MRAELQRRVLDYPREAAEHKRLSGMLEAVAEVVPSEFDDRSVSVAERVRRLATVWIANMERLGRGERPVARVDKDEVSAHLQRLIAAAWPTGTSGDLETLVGLMARRLEGERTSEDEPMRTLLERLDRMLPDTPGSIEDRAQDLLNERAELAAQVAAGVPDSDVFALVGTLMASKLMELAASDAEQGGYFALEAAETFTRLEDGGWRFIPPQRGE